MPKCSYSKLVTLKSDCLIIAMSPVCPKCKEMMDRESVDGLDSIIDSLFGMFRK